MTQQSPLAKVLASGKSPWTEARGPEHDVVLSSRVRLARNFANQPFPNRQNRESAYQVWKVLADYCAAHDTYRFYDLSLSEPLDRQVLVEKHLISPQHAKQDDAFRALVLREDESESIMVNEEDHLRIQGFAPGLDLSALWQRTSALDDAIGANCRYAFDAQYGYLTSCPTNIGTGLRVSVMLHLPAMDRLKQTRILEQLPTMGFAVRGLFGEGSKAHGHFYQVSNQKTLGFREEDLIANLSAAVGRIIELERRCGAHIQSQGLAFLDEAYRAYGILREARSMSAEEAFALLSTIRLGKRLQLLDEVSFETIDGLFLSVQGAGLQFRYGPCASQEACNAQRADHIRTILKKS